MGNFNTPYAILSGLSFAAISRLAITWRAIPGKRLRRFHELEQLYTPHSAYRNLRAAMQTAPLPGVPYIGLCVSLTPLHLAFLFFLEFTDVIAPWQVRQVDGND